MTKILLLAASLAFFPVLATTAPAGTVKLPKEKPVVSVTIPDSWEPEETEDGVQCESPDQVATLIFEVTEQKGMNDLIDASVDWLMKDHKVEVDEKSQTAKDFESGGMQWKRISWQGSSKEHGPADVGFLFTEVGDGQLLAVTYWILHKDQEKQLEEIVKIYQSVKKISS